jgi:hypothetical protein
MHKARGSNREIRQILAPCFLFFYRTLSFIISTKGYAARVTVVMCPEKFVHLRLRS